MLLNSIFPLRFPMKIVLGLHHLCISQFSPTSSVIPQLFGTIKRTLYRERQIPCVPEHGWCTVLTVCKSHTWNSLGDKSELNHTVPTLTNSILSASCVVNLFTDTQYTHSLKLTLQNKTYFDRQAVTFPSLCFLDTHHRNKFIIIYGPNLRLISLKHIAPLLLQVHKFAGPPFCYYNPRKRWK